jgi:hypothetical protein
MFQETVSVQRRESADLGSLRSGIVVGHTARELIDDVIAELGVSGVSLGTFGEGGRLQIERAAPASNGEGSSTD